MARSHTSGEVPTETVQLAILTSGVQIIARIQTPSANIRRNINNLLIDVGKHHPQALVYPLTVASKSSSATRKNAALLIMEQMREHSTSIVDQVSQFMLLLHALIICWKALLVSHELIRVAILWHEMWHEGLEEASRLYFNEKNSEGMIAALEPLHNLLEAVRLMRWTLELLMIDL
jgi:FKBP12-rapamycin complex-associated protein